MTWFIKTERFTSETLSLSPEIRQQYINKHRLWVINLNNSGMKVVSGYLVNSKGLPGRGGLLIIEASSFNEAKYLIKKDPIILANLVEWELHEWRKVCGELNL